MLRKIIQIDEDKCNGCGLCVTGCAEGALKIIDGKARLISEKYCDGLGACLGECPMGAIQIIEREAEAFDEDAVKKMQEESQPKKTSFPMHHHGHGGCPGSRLRTFQEDPEPASAESDDISISIRSQLRQWPVQLHLLPVQAPFFQNADLLISADCVPFAYADFHRELLKGKKVLVGCPKLDDVDAYIEKMTEIFRRNSIRSITIAFMEVPCCSGLVYAVQQALEAADKDIPVHLVKISLDGKRMS